MEMVRRLTLSRQISADREVCKLPRPGTVSREFWFFVDIIKLGVRLIY